MLQLVYVSSARAGLGDIDAAAILESARRRNAAQAITGMLYFDGTRFLQALEGPAEAVQDTLERIRSDARHRAIVVLSSRNVDSREFGSWEMAYRRPGSDAQGFLDKVRHLVAGASADVRATFEGFAELRSRAA